MRGPQAHTHLVVVVVVAACDAVVLVSDPWLAPMLHVLVVSLQGTAGTVAW